MRVFATCSWCHASNRIDDVPVICRQCGHRADVCRLECDCPRCLPNDRHPLDKGAVLSAGRHEDDGILDLDVLDNLLASLEAPEPRPDDDGSMVDLDSL
jgi:hypothetical protein